jgi:DNA-binding CsgD family transcriptional regulator
MDQDLTDRIYESALAPELWPAVLDDLAGIATARGGHIFIATTEVLNWTSSACLVGGMAQMAAGDYVRRGQRCTRLLAARHAGFLTEHDIYADGELEADPFYRDLLWPAGLGWGAGSAVALPTGETLFLALERNRERGPIEPAVVRRLDTLRPHLVRSLLLSARLQLERARAASETLALIGLPALVLDDRGRVVAANDLIAGLTDHVRWRARDGIALNDKAADALFRETIKTLAVEKDGSVRSLVLRGADAEPAMVAHVIPIRRSARDVFVRCAGMLVLTPVRLPKAPQIELIQSLFDMSPAEARVARRLAAGHTVDEIAVLDKVSRNTVRTQVRGVLDKTGCRRQTEVVALLGGVTLPRG